MNMRPVQTANTPAAGVAQANNGNENGTGTGTHYHLKDPVPDHKDPVLVAPAGDPGQAEVTDAATGTPKPGVEATTGHDGATSTGHDGTAQNPENLDHLLVEEGVRTNNGKGNNGQDKGNHFGQLGNPNKGGGGYAGHHGGGSYDAGYTSYSNSATGSRRDSSSWADTRSTSSTAESHRSSSPSPAESRTTESSSSSSRDTSRPPAPVSQSTSRTDTYTSASTASNTAFKASATAGVASASVSLSPTGLAAATSLAGTSVSIDARPSSLGINLTSGNASATSADLASGRPNTATMAPPAPSPLPGQADLRPQSPQTPYPGQTAQGTPTPLAANLRAGQAEMLAAMLTALNSAASRAAPGNPAVLQAHATLAQVLDNAASGRMSAGAAAMALADAQLNLRASRMNLVQAQVLATAAAGTGTAAGTGPAQAQAAAKAQTTGQPTAANTTQATQELAKTGESPKQATQISSDTLMPRKLAELLAKAPKMRKRGSLDRVEKVDRFTPRTQTPEMEDEELWDVLEEEAREQAAKAADEDPANEVIAAAKLHYRAMLLWLQANEQTALLRELAQARRVLVLAPPDTTHQRLVGHMLWPDPAQDGQDAGAKGRAWPLAARWSATLPADTTWRQWRLRQWVDTSGRWQVAASKPDRHTPRLHLAQAPKAGDVGEAITMLEPRQLRRLMGRQWTLLALRVPLPLDGRGAQGPAVAGWR